LRQKTPFSKWTSSKHLLDPTERVSEILSGLIMVLAFTGTFSIATAGPAEVRSMLIGALGCNLASGIVDGVFYIMDRLAERSRGLLELRSAASPEEGQRALASVLPETVAAVIQPAELEAIRGRLARLSQPPELPRPNRNNWLGAVFVCFLVVCSTFPVVIPFLFMHDGPRALRASHGIAIVMMFFVGYAYGRNIGQHPWAMGLAMVLLGSVLAVLTIALGG